MTVSRTWTLLLLLLAVITPHLPPTCAHSRNVENAEYVIDRPVDCSSFSSLCTLQPHAFCVMSISLQQEVHDEFDDKPAISALGGVDQHLKLELEHQMDVDGPFTPRGVVDIVTSTSSQKPQIAFSALPTLSDSDMEKMNRLLRSGSLYTVRAKEDVADPNARYIMTSVPMCMLAAMRLREDFAFHLSESGKLVAIEYLTPYVDAVTCAEYQTSTLKDVHFGPFGSVLKAQIGPSYVTVKV